MIVFDIPKVVLQFREKVEIFNFYDFDLGWCLWTLYVCSKDMISSYCSGRTSSSCRRRRSSSCTRRTSSSCRRRRSSSCRRRRSSSCTGRKPSLKYTKNQIQYIIYVETECVSHIHQENSNWNVSAWKLTAKTARFSWAWFWSNSENYNISIK